VTELSVIQRGSNHADDKDAIRPFQVTFPESDLTELRRRINATKWPERELVADATQGVQLATIQALARYWGTEYDWRKVEARLNALPQFITEIDGLDVHFIHVRSQHENAAFTGAPAPSGLAADEQHAFDRLAFFYKHGLGYALEMGDRPQTLYGIADSPVGLAAWILDHDEASEALMARVFAGHSEGLTRDDILDNITLYWLTNTAISAAPLYWENKLAFFAPKNVAIPVAVSIFPDEVYAAPRSWVERAYPKLIHYNRLPKGCHFAAWEQPKFFCEELRASFRSLRSGAVESAA